MLECIISKIDSTASESLIILTNSTRIKHVTESNKKAKTQQLFFTADLDLPDIDTPIPDLNDLDLDKNRARLEEITLREENDFIDVGDLELNGDQVNSDNLVQRLNQYDAVKYFLGIQFRTRHRS